MISGIKNPTDGKLSKIVPTFNALGLGLGFGESGQQHSRQYRNDGNYHQ
jgi:hypothetical protein